MKLFRGCSQSVGNGQDPTAAKIYDEQKFTDFSL